MVAADYENAMKRANEVLNEFGIKEPVVPVFDIASHKGLKVVFVNMKDLGDEYDKVSGFLDADSKTIYVNQDEPPYRQMFTVAHELGHFVLDHNPDEYGVLYRYAMPVDDEPVEKEANCFAANLLVPKEMLKIVMKKYNLNSNDVEILAKLFGVSKDVVRYRLQYLD